MSLLTRLLAFSLLAISVSAGPPFPDDAPNNAEACWAFGQVLNTILTEVSAIAAPVFAMNPRDTHLMRAEDDIQNAFVSASIMMNSSFLTATQFQPLQSLSTDIQIIIGAEINPDDADTLQHLAPVLDAVLDQTGFSCISGDPILPSTATATATATSIAVLSATVLETCKAFGPIYNVIANIVIPMGQAIVDVHHEFGDTSYDAREASLRDCPAAAAILTNTGSITSDQAGPLINLSNTLGDFVIAADSNQDEDSMILLRGIIDDLLDQVTAAGCIT